MDSFIQVFALIITPFKRTQFFNLTPSLTWQSGPIITLGPITALGSIYAEGSINTFPTMLFPFANILGVCVL